MPGIAAPPIICASDVTIKKAVLPGNCQFDIQLIVQDEARDAQ